MSRVGRVTLLVVSGVLVIFVFGVWAMLDSIDRKLHPACLDQVAEAPDGRFAWIDEEDGEDHDGTTVVYSDGQHTTFFPEPRRISDPPLRIVSTLPGITEMLDHLGAAHALVGVSPWCDVPAGADDPARISVQPLDTEALIAAKPDLVILDRRLHLRDLAKVQQRADRVLLLETSRSLPHLVQSIEVLARVIAGRVGRAQGLEARRAEVAAVTAKAAAFRTRYEALMGRIDSSWPDGPPRVLVLGGWDPLYAMGPGSLLDDLLRICGATNIACDLPTDASGPFQSELVLAREPDWILTPKETMPERMRTRWEHVPAVKHGRLAPAWADDVVRGGPRILDALERLDAVLRGREPPAHLGATK